MAQTQIDPFRHLDPVNLHEAKKLVKMFFSIGWTPNLISDPGIGKSSIIKQICEDMELMMVDLRLASMVPEDMNGLPDFYTKNGVRRATYSPMSFWPLESDYPQNVDGTYDLPINPKTGEPYKGFTVFLDEFNSGTMAIQAASYRVILDKQIGVHDLHSLCNVATAGNLLTSNAIVSELGTATQSRLAHIPVKTCHDTFMFWADANGIDARVKAFLRLRPGLLHDFDPNHDDLTFPCPRTWEGVSDYIKKLGPGPVEVAWRPGISGLIGTHVSREFILFTRCWQELPTMAQIQVDPEGIPIPNDPSVKHAVAGMIGEGLNETNADTLIKYVLRMSPDFQVITLRSAIGRDLRLMQHPAIGEWMKTNRTKLVRKEM